MTDSIYDQLNAYGTVAKQRFVENFSGTALDTDRWDSTLVGSGSVGMTDAVDGGLFLKTGASTNDSTELTFDGKKPFSDTASVMIFTANRISSAGSRYDIGMTNSTDAVYISNNANASKYTMHTSAGSTTETTTFSNNVDTATWHTLKIECKSSTIDGYLDGVLEGTSSTNLPNAGRLEPWLKCTHNNSVVAETRINYVEIYNT